MLSKEGTAAAATEGYESDSSKESRPSRSKSRASATARDRSKSHGLRNEQTAANNPCKHCKKAGRRNRHPNIAEETCFYNKKYKGFRPKYVCKVLDVRYCPREKFSEALGGYASDSTDGSG